MERTQIGIVDITLRDGEQMKKNDVTIADRIAVFDQLVSTGIQTFEIGHLGNSGRDGRFDGDQAFASALIDHIRERELTDDRYKGVKLQVLFGSQTEIMSDSLEVLDSFDKDRIIIHVYDRLPHSLRDLATNPYTSVDAARRVCAATDIALAQGFTHFSISGEGATDCSVEEAIDYYSYIAEYLDVNGAESINVNLANTYGLPPEGEWDYDGLVYFNTKMKQYIPRVTTSVHVHNDDRSANEFSIAAIKAGFDIVEGTLIGMGERCGNVNLGDTMIRLLEIARIEANRSKKPRSTFRIGQIASRAALFEVRCLPEVLVANLHNWYTASQAIGELYGVSKRFENSSLGDPEAYNAGSGPHDNAAERALMNPAKYPLWKNYLHIAIAHAILGRPEAVGILSVNPDVIRQITVNGSAGGNATDRIIKGEVKGVDSREQAIAKAQAEIDAILQVAA